MRWGRRQKHRNMTILPLYSPSLKSETSKQYCNAFRKDTGITVDCIYLPAGEMTARLEQERTQPRRLLCRASADNIFSRERPVC